MSAFVYTGKTADGSDMKRVEPLTLSPCGKYWTNEDLSNMNRKERRKYWQELKRSLKR